MRYDKVFRFLLFAFIIGSALGLVGGLVLGGERHASAHSTKAPAGKGKATTSTTAADKAPEPMTAERARAIGANELGMVLVLEYHKITKPEDQNAPEPDYCRSALHFKQDIELLKSEGYYPITVKELATGNIAIPAGKSPVVLTFDDSSPGQYRVLEDGSIDPECAVGILQAAAKDGTWPMKASFFVLLDVTPPDNILFGQPDLQQEKMRNLVKWGCEVGSHTYTHLNFQKSTSDVIRKELALSKQKIEQLVGGDYQVYTLCVPYGAYPEDVSILRNGEHEGVSYAYKAALEVAGGPSYSPFSTKFDPMRILRIEVQHDALKRAVDNLKKNPDLRYISDGDPAVVSVPASTSEKLGNLADKLGRPVITY
ncbi:MAG: polysaccharide deacetylase family protein [Actinobacteria bacterium]|nr:polysaccharide deacetylase family protein [Actinomycetota bacterium]